VKKNPIMATMNAYGWVKHGGAEAMKLLTVLRPTTPGPGEVLIKLKVGPHV
jgi:NADPH:quinone reductase-like Zn-dependent oxidoreductase